MASDFGILARFEFLQSFASKFISIINPAVIHNLEKYYVLKKVHYLAAIENLEGDYLEFGVFTGSSFCHSIRCYKSCKYLYKNGHQMRFLGFDSFSGFGTLEGSDIHSFYTDQNFKTEKKRVEKRVSKVKGGLDATLVEGFFKDTLVKEPKHYSIDSAAIVFVDSDTYESSRDALKFCETIVKEGTFIILDDFFSYRGSSSKGVKRAFDEFIKQMNCEVRGVYTYGMGGKVFVVDRINS